MEAERIDENELLFKFLLELVLGQWNAVAPELKSFKVNTIEETSGPIGDLAQLLSEELRTLLVHKALVHPRKRFGIIQYGIIVLDADFIIQAMGSTTAAYFGRSEVSMYRSDFNSYLAPSSQIDFLKAVSAMRQDKKSHPKLLKLTFETPEKTQLIADCFIDLLRYGKYDFIVSLFSLKPVVKAHMQDNVEPVAKSVMAAQQVYDFILGHREGMLPTAHEFARRFGTNEFELKKEFKKRFGTSIYQHYSHVRLERAIVLLKQTALPLSEIVHQCGFEDYSGFAKAFRKRYGISPAKARETIDEHNS
ncbi:helix-turn-helix transcriptional regulator [Flavobacterium sp. RHBU_3]|uniref:AraC family transcriptional regulator n=1 Tax=Flavobacterium sp. RHBU_3 TaxID=3391184 RepID=UPI003985554D